MREVRRGFGALPLGLSLTLVEEPLLHSELLLLSFFGFELALLGVVMDLERLVKN